MKISRAVSATKTRQALGLLALYLASCTPTVQVAMPSEPITINLNVRIEHEIQIKVEEELDGIFTADSGLF
ncbi:MAG: YnbE family lipoprotein [Gammaproteobacteria bacterium]|jgi:hypothetical protein|nr:hypothetical protein [Gammaproteobacteria bacterium]MBQ14432.1 hypothetical protein [Gammaproteobacteria bacterium]MDP6096153.1 YnbE family lipoprotein [Gammaproteobacteria bacterium]|tara:strand:- start:7431 stop:7643 length:213 start_codon:yes stop_codon:yes gene_type:complete